MDADISGTILASNKCPDIKGGGPGRIRHRHEVSPTTADVALRVGLTSLGVIEDHSPDRKDSIRIKTMHMKAGPELVLGAIETDGTHGIIR
jgi:hypothetical protein